MKKHKPQNTKKSVFVAFFDPEKRQLVEVEQAALSAEQVTMTSLHLTSMFESGNHRLPSSIWVSFDLVDKLRIFFLDGCLAFQAQAICDSIQNAVVSYRENYQK